MKTKLTQYKFLSKDKSLDNELRLWVEEVVERMFPVLGGSRKILLATDYDADGITSGEQWRLFLTEVFHIEVVFWSPDRWVDGYGPNQKMEDFARQNKCDTVFMLDFGTSSFTSWQQMGIPVLCLDHHEPGDQFPSPYLFNPMFNKKIKYVPCTSGLSYLILKEFSRWISPDPFVFIEDELKWLSGVGTVADMVPLKGINSTLVEQGIEVANSGTYSKFSLFKGPFDESDFGFTFGPMINAAGRLNDVEAARQMFTSGCRDALAELNERRKEITKLGKESVKVVDRGNIVYGILDESFLGVVGLVCSDLVRKYRKPAVVFSKVGDFLKGSVRGIPTISVYDSLKKASLYSLKFGGHHGAGGLTIHSSQLEDWLEAWNESNSSSANYIKEYHVVIANKKNIARTKKFIDNNKPFGIGYEEPYLALNPEDYVLVSRGRYKERHALYRFASKEGGTLTLVQWNTHPKTLEEGKWILFKLNYRDLGRAGIAGIIEEVLDEVIYERDV